MTIVRSQLLDRLSASLGYRLGKTADWLVPSRRRARDLDIELRALQSVSAEPMQHIRQVECEKRELQKAIIAYQEAYRERVGHLEAHITQLTAAVVERENKLQEKAELDYQMVMIHQQLLAECSDTEPQFREIYEHCKPFTMTSIERLYSLYKCVHYLAGAGISGDLAECGVWRGGSCMLMAAVLLRLGKSDRRIIMFDTFEGHPMPDPELDVDLWGNRAYDEWCRQMPGDSSEAWGRAPLEDVRSNLHSTGYPEALLKYIKGMIEDTAHRNLPDRLALLRLDTDWYASTQAALMHLYPRLVPGGVLILDDYGHYKGQRQAVDEYFGATGEHLLFHRIDYSCRVAVKPASGESPANLPGRRPAAG
jgi:Macrocin-O-methyltransferase (TylF)